MDGTINRGITLHCMRTEVIVELERLSSAHALACSGNRGNEGKENDSLGARCSRSLRPMPKPLLRIKVILAEKSSCDCVRIAQM